jgi:hypothetical protein
MRIVNQFLSITINLKVINDFLWQLFYSLCVSITQNDIKNNVHCELCYKLNNEGETLSFK